MKGIWKRIIALALAVVMVGTMTPTTFAQEKLMHPHWMAEVADDIPLSAISIPGTHDSCSRFITPKYFLRCQNRGIYQQLEMGYRYLDIRVAIDEKDGKQRLKLIHAFGNCRKGRTWTSGKLYLEDVLEELYQFLEEEPTETVIFCVKPENSNDDVDTVVHLLQNLLDERPEMWYTDNAIPELGEVRGQAVLANRFFSTSYGLNFNWKDQGDKTVVDIPYNVSMINNRERLWVQDRYKYNIECKWDAFQDDMENCQASEDTFSLNFMSTSGSGTFSHPKHYARVLNDEFKEYELSSDTCYGILIFDFADEEIAAKVIATNE